MKDDSINKKTKSNYDFILLLGIFLFFALLVCWISYRLGADINWDLLNYHFYNGYLYLHGKLISGSLATIQSYLDPLLNSFYYILISSLTPLQANLIIAALQSISISLIFILSMIFLENQSFIPKFIASFAIAVSSILGPAYWSEIGGTMSDTLLASLVIISILFVVKALKINISTKRRFIYISLAGLSVGVASGLKFTNMVYALAIFIVMAIMFFVVKFKFKDKIAILILFSLTATVSFLVVYGPIGWLLWENFKNPIFPYFNNIFRSDYVAPFAIRDGRWFPQSLWGYITLPFQFCVYHHPVPNATHLIGMEIPFRTFLFAAIFIVFPFYIIQRYRQNSTSTNEGYDVMFIVLFFVVAFVIWEVMFSYYRYLAVLEIIAPLTLLVMLLSIVNKRYKNEYSIMVFALVILIMAALDFPRANWGREPFKDTYFGITKKTFAEYNNSLIVVGHAPMGFILPYFPDNDIVLGLPMRIPATNKFEQVYLRKFKTWNGKIYYVSEYDESLSNVKKHAAYLVQNYNLSINYKSCKRIDTSIYPIAICSATKK